VQLMILAAMLAMVLVAAALAMAQTVEGDGDSFQYDIEANGNTFQSQDATNNSVQILTADTDTDNVISGGNVEQDAFQESDQVIQQAQADDGSLTFNSNDLFFWWWF
jgi:Spy/CpxP family protein refolding chaperone